MSDKTIHVIVCTYQGERYIAEQLDSLIAQTYPLIDVHIFDDCSSDNTLDILNKYCNEYKNFYCYENNKNIGFLKNFEKAIQLVVKDTTGKYIALCDQDDIWHPNKLRLSMDALNVLQAQHPDTPLLVHTDLSMIDHRGNALEDSFFKKKGINLQVERSISAVMGHCGVMGNTILMNRSLAVKALPFPKGLKYHDYWLALINELFGVRKTICKPLVRYRIHNRNTSNNNVSNKQSKKEFSDWLKRDYPLPFMEDNRELAIKHLLDSYKVTLSDREVLLGFLSYLNFSFGRLPSFIFLLRHKLLKQSFFYRVSVCYRLMFTKRYGEKDDQ